MNEVVLQNNAVALEQIGIGEIADKATVIVPERRTQKHRASAADGKAEMRKMPGIAIKYALWAPRRCDDIAVVVKHRESIGVFQRARPPLLQGRGRWNREFVLPIILK